MMRIFYSAFLLVVLTVARSDADSYTVIQNLIRNHQYAPAEKNLVELLQTDPSNITYLTTLSDVYISQNKFSEAIDICHSILEKQPDNYAITLKLSRLYSWTGQFKDAVDYYTKAIDPGNNDLTPYIEKARVLGWWGKTERSLLAYEEAYEKFRATWIDYEARGKEKLWSGRLHAAIHYFEKSLDENPDNSEVLFDIAQVYSNSEDFNRAESYYSRLLEVNPYHTAGHQSRQKNHTRVNALSFNAGAALWDANSFERNTEVTAISTYSTVSKRFNSLTFGAVLSRDMYRFENDTDLDQNAIGFSVGYQRPLMFGLGAGFSTKSIINQDVDRESYYAYCWYRMFDIMNVSANVAQNNMINNHGNIISDLNDMSYSLNIEYQAREFLSVGGTVKFGEISDNNNYRRSGIYSRYTLTKRPQNLFVMVEAENISFKSDSNDYFAPDNYSTLSSLLGFRHDIGKTGQYYGADKMYYELKYKIVYDSNDEIASQPSAEFYFDITNRINIGFTYLATISNYYDDHVAYIQLKCIL